MQEYRNKYDDGDIDTCYKSLCLAIVEMAVRDYKKTLLACKRCDSLLVRERKRELETFFKSEWFELLSDLDGKTIIKKCKQIIDATEIQKPKPKANKPKPKDTSKCKAWSDDEIDLLFSDLPAQDISMITGRTVNSVYRKRNSIKTNY